MRKERFLPFLNSPRPTETAVAGASEMPSLERERHQRYIRDFDLPYEAESKLDRHQKEMLLLLKEAARGMERIFAAQVGRDKLRAHFYPKSVTKSVIERANDSNPDILSPYTVVVRTHDDKLITYPMHVAYARLIEENGICDLLRKATRLADKGDNRDHQFRQYLEAKAESLETGDYEPSERLWLLRDDEPGIDIVIGFHDTYTDGLFHKKFAAQAWVGVIDRQLTDDSQWFMNAFLKKWQEASQQEAPKVRMRIDQTVLMSGQAAPYKWTGNSLPCQIEWRQKYGSKFTIFKPVFEDGFGPRLDAYRTIIASTKRMGVPDDLVKTVNLRRYIAHETSHSLGVASDISDRLYEHTDWVKELYCDLLALKGYFEINELSMRERELAIAVSFANGSVEYDAFLREGKREEYHLASTLLLNYCLEKGSVKIEDGQLTWDDPRQVHSDISELFDVVSDIQSNGKARDAEELLVKFYDTLLYPSLMRRGASIPTLVRKAHRRIKQSSEDQPSQGVIGLTG